MINTIAVDFDGTIAHVSNWPDIGDPIPGAIETLQKYHSAGGQIIIWTCREGEQLQSAIAYLDHHGIPYDTINSNIPERIDHWKNDCRKVGADLYIDDKAVQPNWHEIAHLLNVKLVDNPVAAASTDDGNPSAQKHYQVASKQPIEIMQEFTSSEEFVGHLRCSAIKYLLRMGHKESAQKDADKAAVYCAWLSQALRGKKINPRE